MGSEHGLVLISSLLILAFLALVGGALLTTSTVDVRIGDNYKVDTQLLFLAEMGIASAREVLRTSPNALSADLTAAAGTDLRLETSLDLATLLASDDRPLLPSNPADRAGGQAYSDPTGRTIGTYHVFLRNDPIDGANSTSDTNGFVTLLSVARIGARTRILEVEITRGGFGPVHSALTLDGPIGAFLSARSDLFQIDGRDGCAGAPKHAIGVISDVDVARVVDEIPDHTEDRYTGGNPFPDIGNLESLLPGKLTATVGLERIVSRFASNATHTYDPLPGGGQQLSSIGSVGDPSIVVVNGDLVFGPGRGHGVLLVRGSLAFEGNFSWNGLILVVGQGDLQWRQGAHGEIRGGVFIAKTRGAPTLESPLGELLADRGEVSVDFTAAVGNGMYFDSCALRNAYVRLPFSPISVREY